MNTRDDAEECRLTVAALALDIARGDVKESLRRAQCMLDQLPDGEVDVAVLPELFTTGFLHDVGLLKSIAEGPEGPTLRFLHEQASGHNLMLAGSYLVKEDGKYYNRGFLITPDGKHTFYDKRHLFCLSAESTTFAHGHRRPPVVAFRGWNVSMIICYDLRFPVWSRNVDMAADVVLVPANWPESRGYAWRTLLAARSIENQVVMVGADCSGTDEFGMYDGMAMITDALGRQVAPPLAVPPEGCPPPTDPGKLINTPYGPVIEGRLSKSPLLKLREWLPTHRDADRFSVQ